MKIRDEICVFIGEAYLSLAFSVSVSYYLSLSLSLSLFFSDMGCEMAVSGRDEMYEVDLISCGLRPLLTVLDIVFESATYLGSCLACFFSFFSTCAVRRA